MVDPCFLFLYQRNMKNDGFFTPMGPEDEMKSSVFIGPVLRRNGRPNPALSYHIYRNSNII
jgi:hypothetical protein